MINTSTQSEPICRNCDHWSEWLKDFGDCMEYAERRREMIRQGAPPEEWGPKSARATEGGSTCSRFRLRPSDDDK